VHGTAAGRSATLGEGRKEASSWQNASYRPYGLAALAVHIMTNTALTGATYDVDGGQQLLAG
jgi:hypothetical protein